jgi:putative heme-binding domain-containing protein
MRFITSCIVLLGFHAYAQGPLPALIRALGQSHDPQFQLDVLKGMSEGLRGRRDVAMPAGWNELSQKLKQSPNADVRELARSLSVTFGSKDALEELRRTVLDSHVDEAVRRAALQSLVVARDPEFVAPLKALLKDLGLRVHAIKGMAAYDDASIPPAILQVYPSLRTLEKKDALTTLTSRAPFAKALLAAIEEKTVPARDLTADILRLLRSLNDDSVNKALAKQFGVARESGEDKAREISRYRGMVDANPPGDPRRGKEVFARACLQCHALFGEGGKVGPDLTGSDRGNLYYILQNIIDPNAVIPNDFRTSTLETKDDRVITGIVTKQEAASVTIVTANETIVVPKTDVQTLQQGEISLMPEGLIQSMTDADVRDLVAYLKTAKE